MIEQLKDLIARIEPYGPSVLRIGLALVMLYFGSSQLMSPQNFIAWLPHEAALLPIPAQTLIILNGGFEVLFGTLLLIGLYYRPAAFLLGGHLCLITLSIGYTEIGARDFGLALATLAIAAMPTDSKTLDAYFTRKNDIQNFMTHAAMPKNKIAKMP